MKQFGRWQRFLYWFSGKLRCRIINSDDGAPYLERYHLLRLPSGGGLYIHRFLDSDPDRGLHDHPWRHSIGLILSGGYHELRRYTDQGKTVVRRNWIGPGRTNYITANDFHRIVLPEKSEAWTLFMHTGKFKGWGFLEVSPDDEHYRPHDTIEPDGSHDLWWESAPRGRAAGRCDAAWDANSRKAA